MQKYASNMQYNTLKYEKIFCKRWQNKFFKKLKLKTKKTIYLKSAMKIIN